jgi:EAL domain-containing protein (putative c-di-GMP-specific phosphodiesterase class I)
VGAEALIRWHHPQQGMIYPSLFIPIAEQTGFIIPMTEWIIKKVIQDWATLYTQSCHLYISINISPSHLDTGDVKNLIQSLQDVNNRSNANIVFEITENKLVENWATAAQDVIARLKQRGIRFAIDDFGTGYSNISYLQMFDADYLKLDQVFIKKLDQDQISRQIIDSLIDLSNKLGLATIAEGIETEAQLDYLVDQGVRYGQGWLFSRPLPLEDFQNFLRLQPPEQTP